MTMDNKRTSERVLGTYLTPTEVGIMLQISEKTVIRHFKSGKLPGVKIGSKWRSTRTALDKLVSQG
jgi:excisionase family DNA binding protein